MGSRANVPARRDPARPAVPPTRGPRPKGRPILVGLSVLAVIGFFLVSVAPYASSSASADAAPPKVDRFAGQPIQALDVQAEPAAAIARDTYTVKDPPPPPPPTPTATPTPKPTATSDSSDTSSDDSSDSSAPAAGTPDPGSAQAYALQALGGDQTQFNCLVALWNRESHWNVYAYNAGSGAYGIPQALPGSKMASAGPDWQNSYVTQVNWGLGYIDGRYGNPCGAWGHSESTGWY